MAVDSRALPRRLAAPRRLGRARRHRPLPPARRPARGRAADPRLHGALTLRRSAKLTRRVSRTPSGRRCIRILRRVGEPSPSLPRPWLQSFSGLDDVASWSSARPRAPGAGVVVVLRVVVVCGVVLVCGGVPPVPAPAPPGPAARRHRPRRSWPHSRDPARCRSGRRRRCRGRLAVRRRRAGAPGTAPPSRCLAVALDLAVLARRVDAERLGLERRLQVSVRFMYTEQRSVPLQASPHFTKADPHPA